MLQALIVSHYLLNEIDLLFISNHNFIILLNLTLIIIILYALFIHFRLLYISYQNNLGNIILLFKKINLLFPINSNLLVFSRNIRNHSHHGNISILFSYLIQDL